MEVAAVKQLKQKVFVANEVPEECIKNAQVAIVSELSWHIIAPNPFRAHGMGEAMPLPKLSCPVVDVRGVKDDEAMLRVMSTCVDKSAGVFNLAGLLTGLEALGAKISKPDAVEVNAAWRARKEGQVAKKMKAIASYEKSKRVARRGRTQRKVKVH